jgi:hypothetical protein
MSDTTIAAAPFVAALQPYLTAAATAIVGGAITLAAATFRKWTGVQVDAANLAAVRAAAEDEAGKAVAAAEDNLAARKIDVNSQVVAEAARAIANRLPEELKASGVNPGDLNHMIAGAIGQLQAQMTVATQPAALGK